MFKIIFFSVVCFFIISNAAVPKNCQKLEQNLKMRPVYAYVKTLQYFQCGPEFTKLGGKVRKVNACLLKYETSNKEYPDGISYAYFDSSNDIEVKGLFPYDRDGRVGWDGVRDDDKGWCGSAHYTEVQFGDQIELRASKQNHTEGTGCPYKVISDYQTLCK